MPYEESWGLVLLGGRDEIPKGSRGHGEAVTFVQFLGAAITKNRKVGGLNQQKFILSRF